MITVINSPEVDSEPFNELALPEMSRPRNYVHGFNALMWLMGSTFVLIEMELKDDLTGVHVHVPIVQVVLMIISTFMLARGLKENRWPFVVPWVVLSVSHCYTSHFLDLLEMYRVFVSRTIGYIPWLMWGTYCLALVLRIYITLVIIWVVVQQWRRCRVHKLAIN